MAKGFIVDRRRVCRSCGEGIEKGARAKSVNVGHDKLYLHPNCEPPKIPKHVAAAPVSETCWTCGGRIMLTDPGEKVYNDTILVSIKHTRCEFKPKPKPVTAVDALAALERANRKTGGTISIGPVADPAKVTELWERSQAMEKVVRAIVSRIEASQDYFPWEDERTSRNRLVILVGFVTLVALLALLVSAAALWRTFL